MKFLPVLSLMALLSFTQLQAQSGQEEYPEIAKVVNYYLVGGTNNDFSMLKKAFHPEASMVYMKDGKYTNVNAVSFFKRIMKPGPPQNRKTEIVSIDVSGHAAQARLHIDYETFRFIDYMTLLKVDGEWKIISKSFYRQVFDEEGS